MKRLLSRRFLLGFLAAGVVAALVSSLVLRNELRKGLFERYKEEMTAAVRIIAMMPAADIVKNAASIAAASGDRLTVIDGEGRVLVDTSADSRKLDSHLHRSEMQEARLRGVGTASRYSSTLHKEMFYVAVPLSAEGGGRGYVRLARPVTEIALFADEKGKVFLTLLFAIVALFLLTSAYLSIRLLSPLQRLTQFAGRVRSGDYTGSLLIQSQDEIGELAGHVKEMVEFLQEKIRRADDARLKLESVFAGMDEGVMLLDSKNRIESLNRSMEKMLGRKQQGVIGKTILEICRSAELHDALTRARNTGKSICEEIAIGDERPVVMDVAISSVNREFDGEGKTILVFRDVTRLRKLERVRTDFIANVTHEIRTPLTAIIGFTETLQQGAIADRETAGRFLTTIRENAERLNRLVDDLTTLSLLESGEARLNLEDLSLAEALENALLVVGMRATEKGVLIRRELPAGLPPLSGDRDRLAQILINIIDNAVKFTPVGGSIEISALQEDNFLALNIADTGPGIPAAELPRLGERFYRVDKTRSREPGGTGLGLSIVKHLMKAHHGRMEIRSVVGRGTTISLFFPISGKSA